MKHKSIEYPFTHKNPCPISDQSIENHLTEQSEILISFRKNNIIGYKEKWLHGLLIEQMDENSLLDLGLDFLYYEVPLGKVKRNIQFGREHADIFACERNTGALVVVEVKIKDSEIQSGISQGIAYIDWLNKYRKELAPRFKELKWDVDLNNIKLFVIAPGFSFDGINLHENIGEYFGKIQIILINNDWDLNENIRMIDRKVI